MESSFTFEQSLPLCCSLAAIGGVLEVGATAVTAVPAVREIQGKAMQKYLYWFAVAGNVSLQLIGSITSHLVATWFGPVSIVVPFFYSATLLANMLIFGLLLGLEFFTKPMRLGTYIIVVAVVLLPVVGPNIQDDQNIALLLRHWYAITWLLLLIGAMTVTAILLILDISRFSTITRTAILLVARASSITVNLTVSRSFILHPSHLLFVVFVVLKLVSGGVYTYAIVVQSTGVEQARFVPLNASVIILVNAITGVIVWEDWRVITSWYGYSCVFILLWLGCDLLLSVPLLNEDNPMFGANKRASLILRSHVDTESYRPIPDIISVTASINSNEQQQSELVASPEIARQSLSRKEAWKYTTGLAGFLHHESGTIGWGAALPRMSNEQSDNAFHRMNPFRFGKNLIKAAK